jgi:putative DNA primase/helicase
MNLFFGVHELRVFMPDGAKYQGFFDNEEAAFKSLDGVNYKMAAATLNPVADHVYAGHTINPADLTPLIKGAGNADIVSRKWLFLDFDPERISGKTDDNTTDAEKLTALVQAGACVAELSALGWPQPTRVDSGNGFHARYRINLPNNEEATTLVEDVTHTLMTRYPLLDMTGCCAMRPAKLPGTFSRKSPHTEERPQRVSALLSESDGVVSLEQLRALAEKGGADGHPVKTDASEGIVGAAIDTKVARDYLLDFKEHFKLIHRTKAMRIHDGWKIGIYCPLTEADSDPHDEGDSTSSELGIADGRIWFKCQHKTCEGRDMTDFRDAMKERNSKPFQPEPGADVAVVLGGGGAHVPALLHQKLAEDFLDGNRDFLQVTDLEPEQLASWTGSQWKIRRGTRLLHKAVSSYLTDLFKRYPRPKVDPKTGLDPLTGKKPDDPERMLLCSPTLTGTCVYAELHIPDTRAELFDRDQFLLGLPDGMVCDLRTGGIRPMLREDFISRVLAVAPDASHPTPRWTAFLNEVTLGDPALADYLRKLGALCLTAYPMQTIFCLHGGGRNGKGSYQRVLEGILGSQAKSLRPRELGDQKFADDSNKRLFSNVEGCRLVSVNEAESDNLDFNLLKTLTGGDSQNGASLYENARQIRPTWKLLLISNEKPKFPPDNVAIRARVKLVPFLASFAGREESGIDLTLRMELPGILAELIALCPAIIGNDYKLPQPDAVKNATDELFAELDLTTRFQADCLIPGEHVGQGDMVSALARWLQSEDAYSEDNTKKIMAALKKRFGKQYAYRRIKGVLTRSFVGVSLAESLPKGVIV